MNPNTLMQDLKLMRSTVRLQGAALALMGACLLSFSGPDVQHGRT